jgi:hypothetical protein
MIFAILLTIFLAIWWTVAPNHPPLWMTFIAVGWLAFGWTYVMLNI